jgi:competence protein ComFB
MKSPLESVVRELHLELCGTHPEFCSCPKCSDDVTALVMNQTRPRYTTTGLGWAVENAELSSNQTRAELSVLVYEAMRRVAEEPRHTPTKPAASQEKRK